jgi:hypothetical protein
VEFNHTYGAAKAAPFQIGSRPDFQQTLQLLAVRSASRRKRWIGYGMAEAMPGYESNSPSSFPSLHSDILFCENFSRRMHVVVEEIYRWIGADVGYGRSGKKFTACYR